MLPSDRGRAGGGWAGPEDHRRRRYGSSDGATIGTHRVVIISREGGDEEDSEVHDLVPRHYGIAKMSGLTFEVLPDVDNSKTFELTSKGPRRNE